MVLETCEVIPLRVSRRACLVPQAVLRCPVVGTLAVLVLGLVASLIFPERQVDASCGDYLSLHGSSHRFHQLTDVSGSVTDSSPDKNSRLPCQGPHCGRREAPQVPSIPVLTTISVQELAITIRGAASIPTTLTGAVTIEDTVANSAFLMPFWRPPRAS